MSDRIRFKALRIEHTGEVVFTVTVPDDVLDELHEDGAQSLMAIASRPGPAIADTLDALAAVVRTWETGR